MRTKIVPPTDEQRRNFVKYFRKPLQEFIDPQLLDFDIIKFDDWLNPPDGTSTREFILEHYGAMAVVLVENLIRDIGIKFVTGSEADE